MLGSRAGAAHPADAGVESRAPFTTVYLGRAGRIVLAALFYGALVAWILGWRAATSMKTSLVLDALEQAV